MQRNFAKALFLLPFFFALIACGGKSDDNALWLLALGGANGGGASSIGTSPTDAGNGDSGAPATVSDPLQAEAEAILGFSFNHNFYCFGGKNTNNYYTTDMLYHKIYRDRVKACIWDHDYYGKGVTWFPIFMDGLKADHPAAWCKEHVRNKGSSVLKVYESNAVVEYVMNRCYSDLPPVIEPEPAPAPAPTPEPAPGPDPQPAPTPAPQPAPEPAPLTISSWGANIRHPKPGMAYPEATHFSFITSADLPCDSIDYYNQVAEWIQLWEQQADGSWTRRTDVYPTCGLPRSNILFLNLKQGNRIGSIDGAKHFDLNELALKPNTRYRILLSKDIYSLPEPLSGKPQKMNVFNSLGDISGQADQWSGLEFATDSAPCFKAYVDRWGESGNVCNYYQITPNSQGDRFVSRLGCGILTGSKSRFDTSDNRCLNPALFPDVKPGPEVYVGDYDSCEAALDYRDAKCSTDPRSPECKKKALKTGACIENPGTPEEFVRVYYDFDSASFDACQGIKRPDGIFDYGSITANVVAMNDGGPKLTWPSFTIYDSTFYPKYRKAGCSGTPDPEPTPTPDPNCKNTVTLDTTGGRWFETPEGFYTNKRGHKVKIKGIHTYWQNQPLGLKVHACKTGWYKLAVRAKNHGGPRPDFYGAFHLNIESEADGQHYGISVPASDERYYTRGSFVYLKKGDNSLTANWSNDAYKKGVYDANIQIRAVRIRPYDGVPPQISSTWRAGRRFCKTDGRFFGSGRAIYTDQTGSAAHYCFEGLEPGNYRLIVRAKNKGTAPADFKNFMLRVRQNGNDEGMIEIPVSDANYKRGVLEFNIYGDKTDLELSWVNAPAAADGTQALFELKALRLKKLGGVTQSALAAYLKSTSMRRIAVILAISLLLLAGALIWRRRQA